MHQELKRSLLREQGPMTPKYKKLDKLANLWNKTKNPKYKDLWYQYVKEFADGPNNMERRTVSTNSSHKTDNGTYIVSGKSRLF